MASKFGVKTSETRDPLSIASSPKRVSVLRRIKKSTVSIQDKLDLSMIDAGNELPIINPINEYPRTSFATTPTNIPSNIAPPSIL